MELAAAGVYVSIPFCRAKCSFCNFASGVFGAGQMDAYVDRVCAEIAGARKYAAGLGVKAPEAVDTVYFGGGTPSLLEPEMVGRVMRAVRGAFQVEDGAEFTVECAPGQMSDAGLEAWMGAGMNRVSFGVQSFVDAEGAAVGRLHTGDECRREIKRMQAAGLDRVGVDLIAGLPGQTLASWEYSVREAIAAGVEHVSVYMLEVDEGSRLGREKIAGGGRYGAGGLPCDDAVADWYLAGCEWLQGAGLWQYEISNFGTASRHNVKYWRREEYVGFGLDAHTMLRDGVGGVRWANGDEMEGYVGTGLGARAVREVRRVSGKDGFEEAVFLGLRMLRGVSLAELRKEFGGELVGGMMAGVGECLEAGMITVDGDWMRLTGNGRVGSNEVFGRLLCGAAVG